MPVDADVRQFTRSDLRVSNQMVHNQVASAGVGTFQLKQKSGALLALAKGAITLCKGGEPPTRVQEMLARADHEQMVFDGHCSNAQLVDIFQHRLWNPRVKTSGLWTGSASQFATQLSHDAK